MLDQFLANKNMALGDAPIKVDPSTVQSSSRQPWPIRCLSQASPVRRNGQAVNQNGFSDHFPTSMTVTEID
jgi:hypothetical protein